MPWESDLSPLFEIDPSAIRRLKSLDVFATPKKFQVIAAQFSYPAPLLKSLMIEVECLPQPHRSPVIPVTFFNGDLSSLRELDLKCVRTELPWRNMVNLTSFILASTPPGEISTKQLLDFLESAPRLHKFELYCTPLASSDNSGRLVSLTHLKNLAIHGNQPTSLLFDHLLIPVGVVSETELESPRYPLEDHLPRSLDNLRNLSGFTQLHLHLEGRDLDVQFGGPSGRARMSSLRPQGDITRSVLESLARFDTPAVKQLEVIHNNPPSDDLPYQVLPP